MYTHVLNNKQYCWIVSMQNAAYPLARLASGQICRPNVNNLKTLIVKEN